MLTMKSPLEFILVRTNKSRFLVINTEGRNSISMIGKFNKS